MEVVLLVATLVVVGVVWFLVKGSPEITPIDDAGIRHETPAEVVEEAIEDLIDDVDLMKLTKKELLSMAEAKGVTANSRMKKADIIEQLK